MGWAVGYRDGRWVGYGVPAKCDHEGCEADIDRGAAYICGEHPDGEGGCGLFFCSDHLWIGLGDDDPQMCERCCDDETPFEPTPDTVEWVEHMLTDESWERWRDENPDRVATMAGRQEEA